MAQHFLTKDDAYHKKES